MKSLLLVSLVALLIVGHNCNKADDNDKFARVCRAESEALEAFNDYLGNEEEKDALFWEFLRARGERVILGKILNQLRCSDEEEMDDKQVFNQLCSDEITLKSHANNEDPTLKSRIDKMLRSAGWRRKKFADQLWFETRESLVCPKSPSGTKYTDIDVKLREKFQEVCKEEAFYEHVKRKIPDASKGIKLELTQIPLREAEHQFEEAHEAREQFCEGPIEVCCDRSQLEEGQAEASLRAVEILLEMVEGAARLFRSAHEQEMRDNHWEARYERACALERETDPASSPLPVRANILADLHQQARAIRKSIGKGLNKEDCAEEHQAVASKPVELDNNVGPACEHIKARVMCRAMDNANEFEQFKFNGPSFQQKRTSWCGKSKLDIGPKNPRCPTKISNLLTNEALAEAQVLLELLRLDDGSWRLDSLKDNMLNEAREEYKALEWIKQLNERDLHEQSSETRKEKIQQAGKLISDMLARLWDQIAY